MDQNDFIKEKYNGIISKKFRDTDNHNFRTLIIVNADRNIDLVLVKDTIFYSYAIVGDSITKAIGQSEIKVHHQGKVEKFKIDFGCQ